MQNTQNGPNIAFWNKYNPLYFRASCALVRLNPYGLHATNKSSASFCMLWGTNLSSPNNSKSVDSHTGRAFLGIRELILRGEFERGERISELPLVDRLGMSRTPIRLALERLAHIGLLEIAASGGFRVRQFTVDEVRDAIELRGVLEGTAARMAAERLQDESEIDQLVRQCEGIDDDPQLSINSFEHYMDRNESFHDAVINLAKSEMLRRLMEQANSLPFARPSAMVFPTSMLVLSEETVAVAQQQHRSLIEAIRNREGTRAEHIAREHARIGWQVFQVALSDKDVLSRVPGGSLIDVA